MSSPHLPIPSVYGVLFMLVSLSASLYQLAQAAQPQLSQESSEPLQSPQAAGPLGGQSSPATSAQPTEIYVWGEQPVSTATEKNVRQKDLELRPTTTPVDILTSSVPGLYTVQHQGGGKADQYFLRGFDADHGTDFAIFVDGIPVNIVNNAHGQGYADLHWLIPETVDHIEVTKGPYFVQYGDFDTAGAVNIITKRRSVDSNLTMMGGSYSLQRFVSIISPPEGTPLTPFLAFETYHEMGPYKDPLHYIRYNVFTKLTLLSTATSNLSLLGTYFKSGWDASGEIPSRLTRDKILGPFGSVDPSQGGNTQRQNLNLVYNYSDARQAFNAQAWGYFYDLDIYNNFTFFENDPINGDEIEQRDKRGAGGSYLSYRRNYTLSNTPTETLVGFSSRTDIARVGLFNVVDRMRLSTQQNSEINQTNLAWYAQQELRPTSWLRAQIGTRLDKFYYNVRNLTPDAQITTSGTAQGFIANPKVNLIFSPFTDNAWAKRAEIYVNFGGGYHSNDARDVVANPGKAALPRALGGELGLRTKLFDRLDMAINYYRLHLSSELVLDGDTGQFEPAGASQRQGIEGELRYQILDWLSSDLDASYTWSKFTSGDNTGGAIPNAPRALAYGGITARHSSGLEGRIQMRFMGTRYGDEQRQSLLSDWAIFDFLARYKWDRYDFNFSITNLANKNWRGGQNFHSSQIRNDPRLPTVNETAPVNDIHFTPGAPLTVRAGMTVHFDLPTFKRP
ncbi:MAG TPA: TonB-dependent receptor [Acidobacteriota bacterium]|nr:TonB-dependent receptor [Acidobacteriota bacterium]